jgi:hypothetical protein
MDGDHTVRRVPSFGLTYRVSFLNAKLPATLSRRMKLNSPLAFQDTDHHGQTSGSSLGDPKVDQFAGALGDLHSQRQLTPDATALTRHYII